MRTLARPKIALMLLYNIQQLKEERSSRSIHTVGSSQKTYYSVIRILYRIHLGRRLTKVKSTMSRVWISSGKHHCWQPEADFCSLTYFNQITLLKQVSLEKTVDECQYEDVYFKSKSDLFLVKRSFNLIVLFSGVYSVRFLTMKFGASSCDLHDSSDGRSRSANKVGV